MSGADFEKQFGLLFSRREETSESAPPSLKARLYSSLIRKQQESGPLASLDESVASGHAVCVFEKLVQIAPVGEKAKSPFFCQRGKVEQLCSTCYRVCTLRRTLSWRKRSRIILRR